MHLLAALVSRIEVPRTKLVISLKPTDRSTEPVTLSVPWQKPPSKRFRKILLPNGALREHIRPDRAERRLRLITAMARGRDGSTRSLQAPSLTPRNWQSANNARCVKS